MPVAVSSTLPIQTSLTLLQGGPAPQPKFAGGSAAQAMASRRPTQASSPQQPLSNRLGPQPATLRHHSQPPVTDQVRASCTYRSSPLFDMSWHNSDVFSQSMVAPVAGPVHGVYIAPMWQQRKCIYGPALQSEVVMITQVPLLQAFHQASLGHCSASHGMPVPDADAACVGLCRRTQHRARSLFLRG